MEHILTLVIPGEELNGVLHLLAFTFGPKQSGSGIQVDVGSDALHVLTSLLRISFVNSGRQIPKDGHAACILDACSKVGEVRGA